MALANKAPNVTKYVAGGTGDNIIPDGFIKTVEKVWLENFVYSSALTIGIGMVIDIAIIPVGKKITGIEVIGVGGATLGTLSNGTISIGARYGTAAITNATQFLAATTYGALGLSAGTATISVYQPLCANTNLNVEVTGATHTIFMQFGVSSATVTGGNIATKVRYT